MKIVNQKGKRFLALLLAVVMIVGQIPVGVGAEDTTPDEGAETPFVSTEFKAVLTRTVSSVDEIPETTPEGEEILDEEGNPVKNTVIKYIYSVEAQTKKDNESDDAWVKADDSFVTVNWTYDGSATENAALSCDVIYKGMKVTVQAAAPEESATIPEVDSFEKFASEWEVTPPVQDVTLGETVAVAMPTAELDGASWNVSSAVVTDNNITVTDNQMVGDGVRVGTFTLVCNGEELCQVPYTVNVKYVPVADVTFAVDGNNVLVYYGNKETVVTVTMKAAEGAVCDYLPPLVCSAGTVDPNWVKVTEEETSYDSWTKNVTIPANTSADLIVGSFGAKIVIDTVAPTVTIGSAYQNGDFTFISFDYTCGISGVESVTVNDDPVAESVKQLQIERTDKVTVKVTSKAGLSASAEITPLADIAIGDAEVTADNVVGTSGDVTYLRDGAVISYKAYNATVNTEKSEISVSAENGTAATDVTENGASVTFTGDDGKVAKLTDVTVKIEDEFGRTKEIIDTTVYAIDKQAPVITMPVITDGYHGTEQSYTFTVADDYMLLNNGGYATLTYTLEGQEAVSVSSESWTGNQYTLTVKDGQILKNVTVTATDNSGNTATETKDCNVVVDTTAPKITAEIQGVKVTKFYVDADGKHYAYLETPYMGGESEDVTATIVFTLDEINPDAAMLKANGWSDETGKWTWSKSVTIAQDETKALDVTGLTAADLAGNVPVAAIELVSNGTSDSTSYVTQLTLDAEDGKYTKTIYFDRRRPTTGDAAEAPEITLVPVLPEGVAQLTGKNMFNGSFELQMTVFDHSDPNYDAGVDYDAVSWTLEGNTAVTTSKTAPVENVYKIPVAVDGIVETDALKLTVVVPDKVGNTFTYVYNFGVDTKAPVIEIKPDAPAEITAGAYYNFPVKVNVVITDLNLSSNQGDIHIVAKDNNGNVIPGAAVVEGENGNYTITFSDNNEVANGHVEYELSVSSTDAFGVDTHKATDSLVAFKVYQDQSPVKVTVDAGEAAYVDLEGTRYYEADQVTVTAKIEDEEKHFAASTLTYELDDGLGKKTVDFVDGKASFTIGDQDVLIDLSIDVTNIAGTKTTTVSDDADWLFGVDTESDVKIAVDNQAPQFSVTRNAAAQYQKDENGNDDLSRPMGTGYVQTIGGNDYFNSDLTYTITITDKFFSGVDGDIQVVVNDGEPVKVASENGVVKYTVSVDDQNPLSSIKVLAKDIVGKSAVVASDVDQVQSINANTVEAYEFIKYASGNGYIEYSGKQNIVDTVNPVVDATISAVGENGEPHDVEKFFYDGEKFYAYIAPAEKSSNFAGLGGITESDNVYVTLTFTLTEQNPDEARMPMASETADGWKLIDGTWTYAVQTAVEKEKAALIEFAVPVVDRADRIPTADITLAATETEDEDAYPTAITLSPIAAVIEDVVYGEYCARLYVDRGTPEITYDGEIELAPNVKPVAVVNGKDLFNESFSFNLNIGDADSGVKSVNWTLEGEAVGTFIAQTENKDGKVSENGKYTIPVTIINGQISETAEVSVKIVVTDMVDNVYTYIKTFSVDNKDPQVRVVKENSADAYVQTISYSGLLGNNKVVDYYNNMVSYTITASDLFMKDGALTYVIDGKENAVSLTETVDEATGVITYTGSFAVNSNETLTDITFVYSDHAVHNANRANTVITDPDNLTDFADADKKVQLSTNDVVVDMDAPEVEITVASEDKAPVSADGVTYYQSPVTYTVKVTDEFLTDMAVEGQTQMLNLSYTKENQDKVSVSLPTANDGWDVDGNTYTYSFVVAEGEVLTGIELEVYDNSGNPIKVAPADFEIKNNVVTYIGDTVIVDGTNAEILVEKVVDGKFVQDFDGNDYYDGEVTYNFTVTDAFLVNDTTTDAKIQINVTYLDGSKMETIDLLADTTYSGLYSGEDKYTATFTMKDGQAVKDIEIIVVDNAGNISNADNVTVDDEEERTSFETVGETVAFSGLPFIVDMTKPQATLEVKGNVTQYYTNKDGVLFVRINPAAEGNSGEFVTPAEYQTVELILTVSDKNLTLADNEWPIVSNNEDGGAWSSDIHVNEDSTVTYTKTITVKTDEVGVITMDMNVFDLSSNPLVLENIVYKDLNNTIVEEEKHIFFSEDGKFTTKVSADRRRVSSLDDNMAPVIQITPADSSMKTNDGIDLYNGAFTISLDVTDGEASDKNSGIDYVHWSVEDKGVNPVVVNAADNSDNVQNDVHNAHFEIPVALNGNGESNEVFVTITAVDNVGNVTKFQKQIAVDNLAPRIQVTYDNNDVRNGKYFKADRVASITITDINLNPEQYAVVNTTGAASGWTYDGTVGTSSVSFTVEGEHKFDMNCTDRAGNHTADEAVQYTGEAVHEFILDKTRPVITVTFNPSTPSGRDEAGVNYYDQEQNVTVSVRDEYFDSGVTGSVNANMGAGFNLGGFYKNGSNHTASVRYTEGNNYSFDVTVTDLAGNISDTYNSETFSVDLTSPTIVISSGDLTNEELNIVQGDLVLGFTINDEQNNLSGYTVKLTHLNNEFKETVVEGAEYYVVNDVNDRTTVYVNFDSIEAIKSNDGTYNVQITATDYAGHIVSLNPSLNFSLNRFGSTFMTDDEFTANFLEPSVDGNVYQNAVSNKLVIKEINPNKVWQDDTKKTEGSVITIAVNGQSIILEKDVDYTVTMSEEGTGSNKWYVYTYEIDPANFLDGGELVDGNYTVLLYGVDEAGNKNTNESNEYGSVQKDGEGEYSGKITFTLDHKAPVITTYGIESGDSIDAESKQLNINLSDNTPASVKVLVNGVEVVLSETMEGLANDQLWLAQNPETGEYVLNIPESNEKRTVTIVTTDAAGNVSEQVIEDVLITSNAFIRAINNPVIVGSVGVGTVGLIALIIFLLKKKKNKEEQPA